MGVQTTLGAKYYTTKTAPAQYDVAGFDAINDFEEVGQVTEIGELGAVYEVVELKTLADGRTVKRKGTKNDGSLAMSMAYDTSDAGQVLLEAGSDGADRDVLFYHKVELQDGSIKYFSGQIFSYTANVSGADEFVMSSVQIEVDNDVLTKVAP